MVVFHIGASGDPTKAWKKRADEVDLVGFEPRLEAWKELEALPKVLKSQTFYPLAIAGKTERRVFYETRNPECSSFLQPNIELLKKWPKWERMEIVECWEMPALSLDDFCEKYEIYPDVIVLDIHGAELETLQNFSYLDKVSKIIIEVCYIEIWKGQPLIEEVDEFLVSRGFDLVEVEDACWKGEKAFGDALYVNRRIT